MLTITYENVALRLIEQIPEFTEVYKRHLEWNYGEVVPHMLFGQLVEFTADICHKFSESGDLLYKDLLDRIFDFIEAAANAEDKDVVDLVIVSYMEHISKPELTGASGEFIKSQLRPKSRELLRIVDESWSTPRKHTPSVSDRG